MTTELDAFKADPIYKNIPRCQKCRKFLRPHVLWFDESYHGHPLYKYGEAINAFFEADVVIMAGTSFSVGITAAALEIANEVEAEVFVVDPHVKKPPVPFATLIREPAETFFPALAQAVSGRESSGQ